MLFKQDNATVVKYCFGLLVLGFGGRDLYSNFCYLKSDAKLAMYKRRDFQEGFPNCLCRGSAPSN